jgi:FdhD protein
LFIFSALIFERTERSRTSRCSRRAAAAGSVPVQDAASYFAGMNARVEPVPEIALDLTVNGQHAACLRCSPGQLDWLVTGWLVTSGWARTRSDIVSLEIGPGRVHARVASAAAPRVCDPLDFEPIRAEPAESPSLESMSALFRTLYGAAPMGQESGGMHVAGLSSGGALLFALEDVGRHNAVDKVIGRAVAEGLDLMECGLVLSARVSAEIALKAARTGVAWVASRSVPTTLAVEIAARGKLTLIARAASDRARVFDPRGLK